MYKIDKDKCLLCGLCPDVCSVNAINEIGEYKIDLELCIECGECTIICPSQAIIIINL